MVGTLFAVQTISVALWNWATADDTSSNSSNLPVITPELIRREREEEDFEPDSIHVAICGPAGSGKSSIVNALRGLRNNDDEAAPTGTVETTTQRTKYSSHATFNSLFLYDCPGAGTLRVPTEGYYYAQKLYLFDQLLIVHGERLGEASPIPYITKSSQ
jgi:predicted GTPase